MGCEHRDRLLERTITLTDAVVAIAMTLLVLPLVDQVEVFAESGIGSALAQNSDLFLGFVVSFLVIYVFWSAHEHALSMVDELKPPLRGFNVWWLLLIAFLPFPTALVGRHATTVSVPLYIGTMFVLSVLTSTMTVVAARTSSHPEALESRGRGRTALTWATPAVFGLSAVVGAVNPDLGLLGLLLLIVVRIAEVAGPRLAASRAG